MGSEMCIRDRSNQALSARSSRSPSRTKQSDARSPTPYSPRGTSNATTTVSYRPTPKQELLRRGASREDVIPPAQVMPPERPSRNTPSRAHSSLGSVVAKRRHHPVASRSSSSGRCNKRRPSDDHRSGVRHDPPSWRGSSEQVGRPAFRHRWQGPLALSVALCLLSC